MVHFDIVMNENDVVLFQNRILDWYQLHARDLPWRHTKDPYQIWISEIMLQQTRVESVIPYYKRWMDSYRSVEELALAEEDHLLSKWEGLGYYARVQNIHKTAKIIAEKYLGKFPQNLEEVQSLPGIGRYTAGAILSIAFNKKAPILDGNIRRVFTRYFNIDTPIHTKQTETILWQLSEDLIPKTNPGDFNQALMELGALVCRPKNPLCDLCPLQPSCISNQLNIQSDRPVRKPKSTIPHLQVAAGIVLDNSQVLLAKRPHGGLLGGLWEYPGGTQESGETLVETLSREFMEELTIKIEVGNYIGTFHHAYTHYKVTLHAYFCKFLSQNIQLNFHTDVAWVSLKSLGNYPMGKLDRLISNQLQTQ